MSDDPLVKTNFYSQFPESIIDKITPNDLRAVENLRISSKIYTKTGEPLQLIIDSIEDELHAYYE